MDQVFQIDRKADQEKGSIVGLVEKPEFNAPSNLASIGRYI